MTCDPFSLRSRAVIFAGVLCPPWMLLSISFWPYFPLLCRHGMQSHCHLQFFLLCGSRAGDHRWCDVPVDIFWSAGTVPSNHVTSQKGDTFSFRVPKSLPKKAACRYTLQSTFVCPLCCPWFSHATLDWNLTSDGNGIPLLSQHEPLFLAGLLAPHSLGTLRISRYAIIVACCCHVCLQHVCWHCMSIVAVVARLLPICYCSLLRWPMLLVVNIIDFAVLAGPLPIPN